MDVPGNLEFSFESLFLYDLGLSFLQLAISKRELAIFFLEVAYRSPFNFAKPKTEFSKHLQGQRRPFIQHHIEVGACHLEKFYWSYRNNAGRPVTMAFERK